MGSLALALVAATVLQTVLGLTPGKRGTSGLRTCLDAKVLNADSTWHYSWGDLPWGVKCNPPRAREFVPMIWWVYEVVFPHASSAQDCLYTVGAAGVTARKSYRRTSGRSGSGLVSKHFSDSTNPTTRDSPTSLRRRQHSTGRKLTTLLQSSLHRWSLSDLG